MVVTKKSMHEIIFLRTKYKHRKMNACKMGGIWMRLVDYTDSEFYVGDLELQLCKIL